MRTSLIFACALSAGATAAMAQAPAAPAAAPASPLAQDARCALVMNAATQQPQATAQMKDVAGRAMIYYVGKIDGRGAGDRLKALLDREAKAMTPQLAQAEFARCGQAFQTRGTQLRTMGGAPPSAPAQAPAAKR